MDSEQIEIQREHQVAMIAWRKKAIKKLKSAGAKICDEPTNKEIRKWIEILSVGCVLGIEPPPKRKEFVSRRIVSTLPSPVSNSEAKKEDKKKKLKPKSKGYVSRCKKSEPFDLNPEVFYNSWRWKELRLIALDRCGRRCACCGATPAPSNRVMLNVDHIKPIRTNPELALDLSNLQVLCADCNQGKSWFNTNDYRTEQQKVAMSMA